MCSKEPIAINEEGGKIYTFSKDAVYLLKEDITFEYNGIWNMPTFGETGRIEGNGKTIKIKDTSMQEEVYYYYADVNEYKGPLTEEALSWDWSKLASSKLEKSTITGDENIRTAPIPKGFVASQIPGEDTILGGLVIYQGNEAVTGEKNSTLHNTAMTTRNQYVWIPVDDINQMVMCKKNSSTSLCSLALQTDGTLKCEKHNSTDLCGRLYGQSGKTTDTAVPYIWKTTIDFSDRSHTWNTSSYHEPAILSSTYDNDETTEGLAAFEAQMTNDFMDMAISVARYGGFYVGRYEAGYEVVNGVEEIGISKKNSVVLTADSTTDTSTVYKGVGNWHALYNGVHKEIKVNNEIIMQSNMIYGSQYDQIINFLESITSNEPQIGHLNRQLSKQGLTGANSADLMSNIYDFESNVLEWTSQARNDDYRNVRGGFFGHAAGGGYYPASHRMYTVHTNVSVNNATRAALFIK